MSMSAWSKQPSSLLVHVAGAQEAQCLRGGRYRRWMCAMPEGVAKMPGALSSVGTGPACQIEVGSAYMAEALPGTVDATAVLILPLRGSMKQFPKESAI